MCVHLTSGSPAQRPIWTGFVLPTPVFTSHRAPINVNATYSPLHREGSQEEKSKCAKTTAGKKKTPLSNCCIEKAFNTTRTKQILSFPKKDAAPALHLPAAGRDWAASHLPSSRGWRAQCRTAPHHSYLSHVWVALFSPPAPRPLPTEVHPTKKSPRQGSGTGWRWVPSCCALQG